MKQNILLALKLLTVIVAVILACLAYLHFEMAHRQAPVAPPSPPPAASKTTTGLWQDTPPKKVIIQNPFGSANN
jgi:heme/copper-type cytochrome/quinol oxidase subunit 2